jgi:fibronectin type 3 domain-containing protein
MTVSWSTVSKATSYKLYRNISDSNAGLTAIATPKNNSYKDTALTAHTMYYYWVKACKENLDGVQACSDFSQVASEFTLIVPPDVPTTLTLSADSISQITVSWNGNGANSYKLYRNISDSNAGLTAIATEKTSSYIDTGLTADTMYYYWVTACKKSPQGVQSCSDFSKVASKTTQIVPPNVPTGVSLKADSSSQITVSWIGNGAHSYEIYRNTSNSNADLTAIATLKNPSYEDTGLMDDTTYYYWVKACNTNTSGKRCSGFSQVASKATLIVPPSVPTGVSLTADSDSQMTVSWNSVTEAEYYEIYRNTSDSNAGLTAITTLTGTSYEDNTGIESYTTYYYWVKACKKSLQGVQSCSDFSTGRSETTHLSVPRGVSLLAISTSQVRISWNKVNRLIETDYYEIYRNSSNTNSDLDPIAIPFAGSAVSYTNSRLTPQTKYYYWIKACKAGKDDCSAFSEMAFVVTKIIPQLNDTGITWGGNYPSGKQTGIICSPTGFAEGTEQDCHYGRDGEAKASTFAKIGGGKAGFDFTKLSSAGTVLAIQDQRWSSTGSESAGTQWSCVLDNVTSLVWEVKTDVGISSHTANIHHKDNDYRWGGKTAIGRGHKDREDRYNDDWNTLVDGSNAEKLCGFNNWRVPTLSELLSIVDFYKAKESVRVFDIDLAYFPNTSALHGNGYYWSASPYAVETGSRSANKAWYYDFYYSEPWIRNRGALYAVRLVHSSE